MKTTDLFTNNRSAKRLNESLAKTFGQKLNLESFSIEQLEDARNKLRTQIYTARSGSNFNETVENETLSKAQFMHDAIVAELMDRNEPIVDTTVQEGPDFDEQAVVDLLKKFDEDMNEIGGYGDPDYDKIMAALSKGDIESAIDEIWNSYSDQDGGELRNIDSYIQDLESEISYVVQGSDDEGGDTDDAYALASAGHGGDEDYGTFNQDEDYDMDQVRADAAVGIKKSIDKQSDDRIAKLRSDKNKGFMAKVGDKIIGGAKGAAKGFMGKEDMNTNEAYINNAEDAINLLADLRKQSKMAERGQGDPVRPNQLVNDLWDVMQWIEVNMKKSPETESAPPTAKGERMVKHIKKGYADDGKLTDKEKSIAYATAWKQHNKESVETGEDMTRLQEGEIQQASAIVTAKTMVDRVGRWIEELSGMENDTLLQLGDSIRDEMGQEQAKQFISTVAPAIQSALENLKQARETLSGGVRTLTGEEQPAEMLGGEPGADMAAPAEPDAMNAPSGDDLGGEPAGDDFDAAEPAAGGLGDAGREQRESIDRQGRLLKVLAG
jgi:hypothetical protein